MLHARGCSGVDWFSQNILSEPGYEDIHFLDIDRPGMLRPDAVSDVYRLVHRIFTHRTIQARRD